MTKLQATQPENLVRTTDTDNLFLFYCPYWLKAPPSLESEQYWELFLQEKKKWKSE
jgi:hypothetical protein